MKNRPGSSAATTTNFSATKPPQPQQVSTVVTPLINPPKIESNVIKIIQREWDKEVERLDAKKNGSKPK